MLLVLSGWLAACSSAGPAAAAEKWYAGYQALDFQTVQGLTCSARRPEVQLLLQKNYETLHPFRSHSFDISGLEFRTVKQQGGIVTVEVTGTEKLVLDQETSSKEIKKDWYFIRESGEWKWCGDLLNPPPEPNFFSNIPVWVVVAGGLILAVILFALFSGRTHDYSPFYEQSTDGALRRIQEYQAGWIRSFHKVKGYGFVYDERGKSYYINYDSFVDRDSRDLNNGERVLFQAQRTTSGLQARNVIRTENKTRISNPHSRKLVILADRVKKFRQDFRLYRMADLQKELNTCKAFFELLDMDVKRYNIKLADYEVVLLYEVERDLRDLSDEIQAMAYDSRWWVRILHLVLQVLNSVADILQTVSPRTAELLRSMGRSAGHLLDSKRLPLLGPGKSKHP